MATTYTLRDEWLAGAVRELRSDFERDGYSLSRWDTIRVSVGFPSRGAAPGLSQTIGQCWDRVDDDGIPQLFMSPVLENPVRVLDVLVHELAHVVVGCRHGHKAPFKRAALALGLAGKPTATHAGPVLVKRLQSLSAELGAYPHAALDLKKRKKQTTRLIKVECRDDAYIARVSRTTIETHGCPICPVCQESMVIVERV